MKTPPMLAQICAAAVLVAPLGLLGESADDNLITELKLTKYVEPEFPEQVRFEGAAEGSVALAVSRTAAGEPGDILVLAASHPTLAAAAVAAVRQWRFAPADAPGQSKVQLNFRLHGVVVFPFGKSQQLEMANAKLSAPRAARVVPLLQELPQAPKALMQPMPAYPESQVARGRAGTATVRFYVDEEGRVRLPEVLEATAPEFGAAALAAVAQWRYEPPELSGRRVVAMDNWSFKFGPGN